MNRLLEISAVLITGLYLVYSISITSPGQETNIILSWAFISILALFGWYLMTDKFVETRKSE